MEGYRTVKELTDEEIRELKERYYIDQVYNMPTHGELVQIDYLVPREEVEEFYKDVMFTEEDFFCNQ